MRSRPSCSRALPDARDGLKPVHRRILYGMHILKLDPGTAFKKCAKIVGDVMGSFHPHGDQAIYEALVRLAQDFSSRYPLVDGQGNFGNIDGDGAAAYRYTEARMTDVARLLLEGVDEEAVDWRDNYSGDAKEPIVLPSAIPNLLANGAQGIAVGMATSIPPHNVAELCDAALYLIAHPNAEVEALLNFAPGPDFPTGGIVVDDPASIAETYRTGRGGFRLRARWTREETGRGGWVVVVTEIPYGVQKSRLIEQLATLLTERKAHLLGDVRDESAEDVRVVLEPKSRTIEPAMMMEQLFKLSELETRIPVNLNVLVDGVTPRVVSFGEALQQWLDHRRAVLKRRSAHRLAAIERRLELRGGDDRRLPQPRRGHPHHPRGRRAEGGADGALRAHRDPGQLHPRHPPAFAAPARGDGAAQGAEGRSGRRRARSRRCSPAKRSNGRRSPTRSATSGRNSGRTPSSASGARRSRRPTRSRSNSPRR